MGACIAPPRTAWPCGMRCGAAARHAGRRISAIDSLRLEKGYRVWSTDITPEDTPYQAGLGFAVRMDKPGGFIGREALAAAGDTVERRLCCLVLDDPLAVALGNEPIRIGGEVVGRSPPAATATRSPAASPTATCRSAAPRSASGPRWRSSASGSGPRSRPSRYTTEGARVRS